MLSLTSLRLHVETLFYNIPARDASQLKTPSFGPAAHPFPKALVGPPQRAKFSPRRVRVRLETCSHGRSLLLPMDDSTSRSRTRTMQIVPGNRSNAVSSSGRRGRVEARKTSRPHWRTLNSPTGLGPGLRPTVRAVMRLVLADARTDSQRDFPHQYWRTPRSTRSSSCRVIWEHCTSPSGRDEEQRLLLSRSSRSKTMPFSSLRRAGDLHHASHCPAECLRKKSSSFPLAVDTKRA